jgi:hypothetical protein
VSATLGRPTPEMPTLYRAQSRVFKTLKSEDFVMTPSSCRNFLVRRRHRHRHRHQSTVVALSSTIAITAPDYASRCQLLPLTLAPPRAVPGTAPDPGTAPAPLASVPASTAAGSPQQQQQGLHL